MSLTRTVLPAVPSVFHSSEPWKPSLAAKNKVPFTFVKLDGKDEYVPLPMSSTSTVPASVPSLFQSSRPCVSSTALKNSVPLTLAKLTGSECCGPGLMSLTRTVPAAVPSVFHNSRPCVPSSTLKKSVLPTAVKSVGWPPGNGLMSFTSVAEGVRRSSSRSTRGRPWGLLCRVGRATGLANRNKGVRDIIEGVLLSLAANRRIVSNQRAPRSELLRHLARAPSRSLHHHPDL